MCVGGLGSLGGVVGFREGVAEEFVALFRAVTTEALPLAHFIDCLVHGLAHGDGERFCDITDAAPDEAGGAVGVRVGKGLHAAVDFRKEVARLEL